MGATRASQDRPRLKKCSLGIPSVTLEPPKGNINSLSSIWGRPRVTETRADKTNVNDDDDEDEAEDENEDEEGDDDDDHHLRFCSGALDLHNVVGGTREAF